MSKVAHKQVKVTLSLEKRTFELPYASNCSAVTHYITGNTASTHKLNSVARIFSNNALPNSNGNTLQEVCLGELITFWNALHYR